MRDKKLAFISYLWVFNLIVMLHRRKHLFVQFHALQGFVLFVLSVIFFFIPVINKYLLIIIVCYMVLGAYQAHNGRYYKLPLLGDAIFLLRRKAREEEKIQKIEAKIQHEKKLDQAKRRGVHALTKDEKILEHELGIFCYAWIIALVMLFTKGRTSSFIRFHARQGTMIFVLSLIFMLIPGSIGFVLQVILIFFTVMGIASSLDGRMFKLPLIFKMEKVMKNFAYTWSFIKTLFVFMFKYVFHALEAHKKHQFRAIFDEIYNKYRIQRSDNHMQEKYNKAATLSYLFLGPLFYHTYRDIKFISFHARQAIVLNFILILVIVAAVFLPYVRFVLIFSWIALLLIGMFCAHHGELKKIPIIYDITNSKAGKAICWVFLKIGRVLVGKPKQ